ncbi:hypothetical protein [Rickettsiales endosymbiont of Trichoplax sp. H2]|uniref:hypothetical protein n=1 Tax=Rickettsiales endosymbiont of Trichoplax sp. H2 TaxID=2021221 RepID=UPI0012B3B6FF|nr:hypothetical protein [Rickettsiales endosymbiont of Trichoplax sp. H2]MSO14598.1 hypothetical protein [Rickettsiales endosymbiont of Trichoplax sp. H2]
MDDYKSSDNLEKKKGSEHKKGQQIAYSSIVHPIHNLDQHASDNAFNQYANINYQYQGTDILTIGRVLLQGIVDVKFIGALGKGNAHLNAEAILVPLLPNLEQGMRLVGTYNTSGNHWIAFAIIEGDNKKKKVAYNDSLGHKREDFEKEMKEILGDDVEFHEYLEKTQKEFPAVACGLFALKNMEVLARANDIGEVDGFYSTTGNYNRAISLLRHDFALTYANGVYEETVAILGERAIRHAVAELRGTESEKLKELIEDEIDCEIICEVRTEENVMKYGYHILFASEDTEQVKKALSELVNDHAQIEVIDLQNGKSKIKVMPGEIANEDILEIIEGNNQETVVPQVPSIENIQADWKQALNLGGRIFDPTLKEAISKATGVELEDGTKMLAEGLKYSLHGNLYQWSLLTWVALKADSEKQFQLITEAEGFEKFDDLVLEYDERIIFLQAKHSSKDLGTDDYTEKDFVDNNYKGEASLAKYFDSWYRLKDGKYKGKDGYYVFITNRNVMDSDGYLEDYNVNMPELELGARTLRFKQGDSRKDFITAIRASSKEVADYDGDYDIDIDDDVYEEAAQYIAKKFRDFAKGNKSGKSEFDINGSAQISKEARAVIKLAQVDDDVLNKTIEKIKEIEKGKRNAKDKPVTNDEAAFKNWLRAKDNDVFKIKIDIKNPQQILSEVLLDEINKFLDQFILKVEQLNFGGMLEMIQEETSLETPIAASEFCANVGQKVLMWFAEPKICVLSSEEIKGIIEEAKGDAFRFYFLHETLEINALEGAALPEIKDFLEMKDQGVIRIENSPGLDLRLAQTIKEQGIHVDQYAFFKGTSGYLEYAPTIMNGAQIQVAVLDYSGTGDDVPFDMNDLSDILESSEKKGKKIILLVKEDDKRFDQFGEELQIESELPDDLLDQIIAKNAGKTVNLAGKHFLLSALTNNKDTGFYHALKRADFLFDILNQPKAEEVGLGLPYGVYIENELVRGEDVYQWPSILLITETNLLVINNMDVDELNKILEHDSFKERVVRGQTKVNDKTKYRLIESRDDLEKHGKEENVIHICIGDFLTKEESELYDNNYIILDVNDHEATIQELGNVRMPVANSYRFTEENAVKRSEIEYSNFCIVSANAGRGKSSFCLNERHKWVEKEEVGGYSWVVRVNLANLEFNGDTLKDLFNMRTTSVAWPDWQLETFTYDMGISGMIKILLDGFDEIKDVSIIQELGIWMSTLPREVNLVLTTRPYAAHNIPMPDNRDLDLFLTLNQYTDEERDDYVRDYITAVFKGEEDINLEKIIAKYQGMIASSPENIRSTLGIPLESYLFCSGFESDMVADYEVLQGGGEIETIAEASLGAIDLFERFLRGKLLIFLDKHLQVESHLKLKHEHFFYTSTALYMDILQAFAFRQVFSLDYQVVENALKDRYFDDEIMEDLEDTGLLTVERRGGQYHLSFNHATYQEYFAALKIVSGLSTNNLDVEKIFKEYKHYMPAFQVIFQFAAQISLSDSKFLSRFTLTQEMTVVNFWGALYGDVSESSDILGVAEANLIQRCLNVLSGDNLEILEKLTTDQLWHGKLLETKKEGRDSKQKSKISVQDVPIERTKKAGEPAEFETERVEKRIAEFCDDKNSLNELEGYINSFGWAERREVRKILAKELLSKKEWDIEGSYWALDFGITAIGFCGEFFSRELADKLKIRADAWDNNFRSALTSLDTIYDAVYGTIWNENEHGIREAFYYGIGLLLESRNNDGFSKATFLNLRKVSNSLLEYFGDSSEYTSSFPQMLRIALEAGYAVVISAGDRELRFIGENEVIISQEILEFRKALGILRNTQNENPEGFIKKFENNAKLIKLARQEELKRQLESFDLEGLQNYFIGKFITFSGGKQLGEVREFFNDLEEINFPHVNLAKKIFAENFLQGQQEANRFWWYDFGAKAIVYCGRYINEGAKQEIIERGRVIYASDVEDLIIDSCSSLVDELNDEARKVQDPNVLPEIAEGLRQIGDIRRSIDKKALEKIDEGIAYIESIIGQITSGFSLEQARMLYDMGVIRPIQKDNVLIGVQEEEKGKAAVYREYLIGEGFEVYSTTAMNSFLALRMKNLDDANELGLKLLQSQIIRDSSNMESLSQVISLLANRERQTIVMPLLIPSILEKGLMHWVGMIIDQRKSWIAMKYFDSENQDMPLSLGMFVSDIFEVRNLECPVKFEQIKVEQQRYNNCGPEVIENFMLCLAGTRATQESAIFLHSLLLENTLLDQEYILKIEENKKLIELFSNTAPFLVHMAVGPNADISVSTITSLPAGEHCSLITNQANDNTGSIPDIKFNFVKSLNSYIEYYLKKLFLPNEFYEMQQLANKHKVDIKIVDEVTLKQAYKKIALKTHPDKYPDATEDFIKAKLLLEQEDTPLPIGLYTAIIERLQKTNIIVKATDTAIDIVRAFKDPSLENVLKVGTGCIYLTSMYIGKTGVMLPVAVAEAGYQVYQGDYWEAAISMTKTIGYTLVFSTAYVTAPAIAVATSTGFTCYATYSMLNNGYELYNDLLEPNPTNNTNSNQDDFLF